LPLPSPSKSATPTPSISATPTPSGRATIYTFTYSEGDHGSITGAKSQSVTRGNSGTPVTAVPDAGYRFFKWSDGRSTNPRTDANASKNIYVTAIFAGNNVTVTFDTQDGSAVSPVRTTAGGTIGPDPATPTKTGYTFAGWFEAATGGTPISFPYTNTASADFKLFAHWTPVIYTFTYTAGTGGSLTGSTKQSVEFSTNGTPVTAVADSGFSFTGWSDGNTSNPRTDFNASGNITVSAIFGAMSGGGGSSGGGGYKSEKIGSNSTSSFGVQSTGRTGALREPTPYV
jgi:uncharacterized repeat protein (TIGR02543 family)